MNTKSLLCLIGAIVCFVSTPVHANYVVFRSDAPFLGAATSHSLTTADGLLTVAGWANAAATTPANLDQWWWIEGVNSGTGNGALIDGQESMTLQPNETQVLRGLGSLAGLSAAGCRGATPAAGAGTDQQHRRWHKHQLV